MIVFFSFLFSDSSIRSINHQNNHNFSLQNETVSDSLMDKFNNLSCQTTTSTNDRIIRKIHINKDPINYSNVDGRELLNKNFSLGISIVQGSDNNVYVKDLVRGGSGERNGVQIGDQIIAVDGRSLLNLSYMESLKVLQNTGQLVELVISQIYRGDMNKRKLV